MQFKSLTLSEIETLGINRFDPETGTLKTPFIFKNRFISTDGSLLRKDYSKNNITPISTITTITTNSGGEDFNKYQLYQETDLIVDYGDFELITLADGTRELQNLVTIPPLNGLPYASLPKKFNGVNQGVSDMNIPINASVCSIAFTIYDTLDTDGILFKFTSSTSLIKISGANLVFTDSSGDTILATNITQGVYVLVLDGIYITVYHNGIFIDTVTPTSTVLTILSDISPSDNRTSSTIGNIFIINDEMTSSEVLSQFNNQELFIIDLEPTRLIEWFPMTNTNGTITSWNNYAETEKLQNGDFTNGLTDWVVGNDAGASSIIVNGNDQLVLDYVATDNIYLNISQTEVHASPGAFLFRIDIASITGTIKAQDIDTNASYGTFSTSGVHYSVAYQDNSTFVMSRDNAAIDVYAIVNSMSVSQLSGTYFIDNFTQSMLINQRNIGLQVLNYELQNDIDDRVIGLKTGLNFYNTELVDTQYPVVYTESKSFIFIVDIRGADTTSDGFILQATGGSGTSSLYAKFVSGTDNNVEINVNALGVTNTIITGKTYFVISYTETEYKLYINSVLTGTENTLGGTLTSTSLEIGSNLNNTIELFEIADHALDQTEVTAKYNEALADGLLPPVDSVTLPYTNNLLLWLTGRISSFTLDGNDINNWADQSGLINDLSQTTAVLKPEKTTVAGFDAALYSNTTKSHLARTDSLGLTGSPALTIMVVLQSTLNANQNTVCKIGGNNAGSLTITKRPSGSSHTLLTAFQNGSIQWNYNFTTDLILLTMTRPASSDHNSTRIYINGVEISQSTSNSNGLAFTDTMCISGSQDFIGSNAWDGTMSEKIIYNEELSTVNREAVENSIMTAYGIV